jgi:acetate kinase
MKIAVINSGSSSLKYKLFDLEKMQEIEAKIVEHIGEDGSKIDNHQEALASLEIDFSKLDAIGHRVVHGGEKFCSSTLIDQEMIQELKTLIPLAPLHNPANILGIEVSLQNAADVKQIAVFDTAFHATLPKEAFMYALPLEMYEKHHIRRYGFHGSSHSFVSKMAAKQLNKPYDEVNMITLHLGNGASVCAIKQGKSIDTSMGFTPLEGLIMGTRSGDIDPAIVLYMQRELGLSVEEVDTILNKKSGLLGVCNKNDLREIIESEDANALLVVDMMVRRIQKYIGAYMALLPSVDAIVFSGGIGENSAYIREKVLDSKLFENITSFVIRTDEELEIALECKKILDGL